MGYSFFNVNRLTVAETNLLVDAFNQREKEKTKKLNQKSKRK